MFKRKNIINTFILIFLSFIIYLLFNNCGEKNSDSLSTSTNQHFSMPLKIGNYWDYDYRIEIDTYVTVGKIKCIITDTEIINNSIWFVGNITGDSLINNQTYKSIDQICYLKEVNNNLYNYYNDKIISFPMFAPENYNTLIKWNGKRFNNIFELKYFLRFNFIDKIEKENMFYINKIKYGSSNSDTDVSICLKYPITIGDSWVIYNDKDLNLIIEKYVENFEYHTVGSQQIFCAKIKYNYYFNNENQPDTGIIYYLWLSNYGMVDKYAKVLEIQRVDNQGNIFETINTEERYILRDYKIE